MGSLSRRTGRSRRRSRALRLGVAVVALAGPALFSSTASAGEIAGDPLQISMDGSGNLQVWFTGATHGELWPDDAQFARGSGMTFGVYDAAGDSVETCGPYGTPVTPVSGPSAVTGDGSEANPFEMSTTYSCEYGGSPPLDITQTFDYVNGDSDFLASYVVTNPGPTAADFRAVSVGSFAAGGSSMGQGFLDQTAPLSVGFFNDAQGSDGGFEEVPSTPWSSFLERGQDAPSDFSPYPDLSGPALPDTVDTAFLEDPLVDAEFDQYRTAGLAPGASATFDVGWYFDQYDGLSLSPATDTKTAGGVEDVTATSLNDGQPVDGGVIRYTITGANPSSGVVSTAADGTAAISWTGTNAGQDTLTAFLDTDDTGVFDPTNDTEESASVTWTAPPPAPAPAVPLSAAPSPAAPAVPAAAPKPQLKPKPAVVRCVVPALRGKSTARATRLLAAAHCALGKVTKPRHAHGRLVVAGQQPAAASLHAAGARVSIRLETVKARG
jgi:hypothetical protein